MQETRVRSPGREDPLETGTATRSSVLAWSIPRTRSRRATQGWDTPERLPRCVEWSPSPAARAGAAWAGGSPAPSLWPPGAPAAAPQPWLTEESQLACRVRCLPGCPLQKPPAPAGEELGPWLQNLAWPRASPWGLGSLASLRWPGSSS